MTLANFKASNHPQQTAKRGPVVHLDAETLMPVGISKPCPSSQVAHLGVMQPGGSRLWCGLLAGHTGPHVFHMEWTDPTSTAPSLADRMKAAEQPTRRPR